MIAVRCVPEVGPAEDKVKSTGEKANRCSGQVDVRDAAQGLAGRPADRQFMEWTLDLFGTDGPPKHAVCIHSGGVDSTTLAFVLRSAGSQLSLVSFDYGQRHRRELVAARAVAEYLDAPHDVIDIHAIGAALTGSALTDPTVNVPHGHYTDQSMRRTVVPNRNAIMLDIATAMAVAREADSVAFGAHGGDHPIYPDCRPEFVHAYSAMVRIANAGFIAPDFRVLAPFLSISKADVVRTGARLGVPFELTWSCYEGNEEHCGLCGTCVERREAFVLAGAPDLTAYDRTGSSSGGTG